jgi:hypothetical protein
MATNNDVRAVRKVLYDRHRREKLGIELNSIITLMNFDPLQPLPGTDDLRVYPGIGPLWFVPATGAVSPGVLEAADRCERVASILMKMRKEIGDLGIPGSDKRHLREGLEQQAKGWRARARLWRDPGQPDAEAGAAEIMGHDRKSLRELTKVQFYLKGVGFG